MWTFGFLTNEEGPMCCPATSVRNYHYSLRNDPEESSFLLITFVKASILTINS